MLGASTQPILQDALDPSHALERFHLAGVIFIFRTRGFRDQQPCQQPGFSAFIRQPEFRHDPDPEPPRAGINPAQGLFVHVRDHFHHAFQLRLRGKRDQSDRLLSVPVIRVDCLDAKQGRRVSLEHKVLLVRPQPQHFE